MNEYAIPSEKFTLHLEMHKPNRSPIGAIQNAFNREITLRLGRLNEVKFTLPYWVNRLDKRIKNPEIDRIKTMYQMKMTMNGQSEWFILSNKVKSTSDGKEILNVTFTSLGYQLRGKKIRNWAGVWISGEFVKEALTAKQVLDNLLSTSVWSVSYIDADFLTKHRSFDFSGTSVLDAVYQVAEKFGGIILWDTEKKSIQLVKQENVGRNQGLEIRYGNYLKSLSQEELADEVVTRLYVYGQDDLTIHRVNPLGTGYHEDFGYFMQGFQMDEDKRVISSSENGMSDALCIALLDYNKIIEANKGRFKELISQQDAIDKQVSEKEIEIADIAEKIKSQQNILDVKQSEERDASVEIAEIARLEALMKIAQADLTALNAQLLVIITQVEEIKAQLNIETIMSPELLQELDNYIFEQDWENGDYTDDGDLYEDSLKDFQELKKPRTVLNLDIISLQNLLEGKQTWKKLVLGDKFNIVYESFGIKSETQLIEVTIGLDNNSTSITIADTKDIESEEDRLAKILYNSIGTSKVVDMSKFKLDSINNIKNDVNDLINSEWDAAKHSIISGVDNKTVIDNRGITTTSTTDPNRFLRMNNATIGMTRDGGNTFKTAISADGVISERLIGKILIGEHLEMENTSGKFSFNQFGVTIDGASFTITGGLPKEQIDTSFTEGFFELNKEYSNGIKMDSVSGMVVTRSDDKVRAYFNATDGFKFSTKTGTLWKDTFYYDVVNNRLVLNGEGNFTELKVNGSSVLTADKYKINGDSIDKIKTDQIVVGTAKIGTAMIESLEVGKNVIMGANATISYGQIYNKPYIPQSASDIGALPTNTPYLTYITSSGIYTGTLSANQINAGYISANRINGGTISGVTINVTTDLYVGSIVNLGGGGTRGIRFNGSSAWIYNSGDFSLTLDASYVYASGDLYSYSRAMGMRNMPVITGSSVNQACSLGLSPAGVLTVFRPDGTSVSFRPS